MQSAPSVMHRPRTPGWVRAGILTFLCVKVLQYRQADNMIGENAFMIFNDKNDKDNIKPFHDTIFISPSQMRPSCSVVPVDGDDEQ